MGELTVKQAETLYLIVKHAIVQGWSIPTAKELAKGLGISERTALDRRNRLMRNHPKLFIKKSSRNIKIDYSLLCTEPETARFYLDIYEKCQHNKDGKIHKDDAMELMGISDREEAEKFLRQLIKTQYLISVELSGSIQVGPMLFDLLEYIRLTAGRKRAVVSSYRPIRDSVKKR